MAFGAMMLVIVSITPRLYLHDLFANHTDVSYCNHSQEAGPCIHAQGYNCQLNELVVPGEYMQSAEICKDLPINFNSTPGNNFPPFIIQNINSDMSGRSPPRIV